MRRQEAAPEQERFVRHGLAMGQSGGAQSEQIHKMGRNRIRVAPFVRNCEMVFFPSAVKKRKGAMIENIKEGAQREIARADAFPKQGRIIKREQALGTREPHEIDLHSGRRTLGPIQLRNLTGGEREIGRGAKAHRFRSGIGKPADRREVGQKAQQQADGLKKVEGMRVVAQRFFNERQVLRF